MQNHTNSTVLMYHGIVADPPVTPPDREPGAVLYDVSIKNFREQMQWLKDKGSDPIITFDDGELNNYQQAFPIITEYGWKAYFFVIVKRIGKEGYMNWSELKELHKAGMIIGSHGLTHEILTNLLDSQMEEELSASKKNLEINLGIPIDTISIPRGFCNDKIIETACKLGYKTVFISERPAGLKSQCLSRIAVKSDWSLKRFDQALNRKTPFRDIVGGIIIKILKTILRESGYNWFRSFLIKIWR